MGHGKVWKSGTAMMPGFGAARKKGPMRQNHD
jgi:hypothetical protein